MNQRPITSYPLCQSAYTRLLEILGKVNVTRITASCSKPHALHIFGLPALNSCTLQAGVALEYLGLYVSPYEGNNFLSAFQGLGVVKLNDKSVNFNKLLLINALQTMRQQNNSGMNVVSLINSTCDKWM